MIEIVIQPVAHPWPPDKLADATIRFVAGPLAGTKLIGFQVWRTARPDVVRVTVPSRRHTSRNGTREIALLRPIVEPDEIDRVKGLVASAYQAFVKGAAPHDAATT